VTRFDINRNKVDLSQVTIILISTRRYIENKEWSKEPFRARNHLKKRKGIKNNIYLSKFLFSFKIVGRERKITFS